MCIGLFRDALRRSDCLSKSIAVAITDRVAGVTHSIKARMKADRSATFDYRRKKDYIRSLRRNTR